MQNQSNVAGASMVIDKQKLKALADRVLNERRFCVDEHHRELAEGVHALMAEVVFLLESRAEARADRNNIGDRYDDAIIECEQLKAENEAMSGALGNLLSLYEHDEGCLELPQYKCAAAALRARNARL